MTTYKFVNFFNAELLETISSGATTMKVLPSQAALIDIYTVAANIETRLVLWNGQQNPEIVAVTANNGSGTLTIARGKETTTARQWPAGTQAVSTLTEEVINEALAGVGDITVVGDVRYLKLIGGTLTGPLTLSGAPTVNLHAATKLYVDQQTEDLISTDGFAMTGPIDMAGEAMTNLPEPTVGSHPATKTYVDNAVAAINTKLADLNGITTAGTSVAYTLNTAGDLALAIGLKISFKPHVTNGAAATLSKDSGAAKALQIATGVAAPEGALLAGVNYEAIYDGTAWIISHNLEISSGGVPVGGELPFAGAVAPAGFLFEYGQAINRTTYARLFSVIGTTFGSGNGSTTFNVPDGRGYVYAGKDNMGGSAVNRLTTGGGGVDGGTLGAVGGVQNRSLVEANIPAHTHGAIADHTHGFPTGTSQSLNEGSGNSLNRWSGGGSGVTNSGGGHTHDSFGAATVTPVITVQPTAVRNFIIKY